MSLRSLLNQRVLTNLYKAGSLRGLATRTSNRGGLPNTQSLVAPRRYQSTGVQKPKDSVSWKTVGVTLGISGLLVVAAVKARQQKKKFCEFGRNLRLTDHTGKTREIKDFQGQWVFIYFGTTKGADRDGVAKMIKASDILEQRHATTKVQPLFVTIDPETDDVKVLEAYAKEISPKLIGLTATKEQMSEVTRFGFGFGSGKCHRARKSRIFLIGPDGKFVSYYRRGETAEQIADDVDRTLKRKSA